MAAPSIERHPAGLIVERVGAVARLTIDRPQTRNNLTVELVDALGAIMAALEAEGAVRVAVLRGAGGAAFSSGFDIGALDRSGQTGPDGFYDNDRRLDAAFQAIERARFPVVAAIRGHCIGGGLELAMACDLRIASDDSRFRMPPAMLGWVYALNGLRRFTGAVGAARTRMLFLGGETLDAATAATWGLIHEAVPAHAWEARVDALAQRMAEAAPIALHGLKQAIAALARGSVAEEDFAEHLRLRDRAIASDDLAEGRRAFLERRVPKFTGR
ncbi:MAG TPA: enoyl-CoA hydratase-related protein [Azospirillum sp.]|nr:enoyl-CoA hydratase-related protein [Azospirillum sp.]